MSARERLALDLAIFVLVMAAANPAITGLTLHEWLGIVLVVPALIHLVLNWDWVLRAIGGFLVRIRSVARVNLVVDAGLFVSLVAVTLSGFLVIPGLASTLGLETSPSWHLVHLVSANLTVALVLFHFALHGKWMWGVLRRLLTPPSAARIPAPGARGISSADSRPSAATLERR